MFTRGYLDFSQQVVLLSLTKSLQLVLKTQALQSIFMGFLYFCSRSRCNISQKISHSIFFAPKLLRMSPPMFNIPLVNAQLSYRCRLQIDSALIRLNFSLPLNLMADSFVLRTVASFYHFTIFPNFIVRLNITTFINIRHCK